MHVEVSSMESLKGEYSDHCIHNVEIVLDSVDGFIYYESSHRDSGDHVDQKVNNVVPFGSVPFENVISGDFSKETDYCDFGYGDKAVPDVVSVRSLVIVGDGSKNEEAMDDDS